MTLKTRIIKHVCIMIWYAAILSGCVPAGQEEEIARMEAELRREKQELATEIVQVMLDVALISHMLTEDTLLARGVENLILSQEQRDTILTLAAIADSFTYSGPRLLDPDSVSTAQLALCTATLYFYVVQQDLLHDDYTDEWNTRVRGRYDTAVYLSHIVGDAINDIRNSIGRTP